MTDRNRKIAIVVAAVLGVAALLYLGGLFCQLLTNYDAWLNDNGLTGQATMQPISWSPFVCFPLAFTGNGIKGMLLLLGICGAIFLYVKIHDKFDGKNQDPRGFTTSKSGLYGSASWMTDKEMKEMLEINPIEKAEGTIGKSSECRPCEAWSARRNTPEAPDLSVPDRSGSSERHCLQRHNHLRS